MIGKRPAADGTFCPLVRGDCVERRCRFWVHLVGEDPQTGALRDDYQCAISWLPLLLVENARRSVGVAAATEELRNTVYRLPERLAEPLTALAAAVLTAAPRRSALARPRGGDEDEGG